MERTKLSRPSGPRPGASAAPLERRRPSIAPWVAVSCLALVAAPAQGPAGASAFHYGDGARSSVPLSAAEPISLDTSSSAARGLRRAHVLRVLALMPHMAASASCDPALRGARRPPRRGPAPRHLADVARTPDAAQRLPGRAALPGRPRHRSTTAPPRGQPSRGQAPVAEAREGVPLYPAGASWPTSSSDQDARGYGQTPATDEWVHQLGRSAPRVLRHLPREMRLPCDVFSNRPARGVSAADRGTSPTAASDPTQPRPETEESRRWGGETAQGEPRRELSPRGESEAARR